MITISKRAFGQRRVDLQLVLPFEHRNKSRWRTTAANGEEARLLLERGTVLRGGDLLLADDGRVVEIIAAPETVSTAQTTDARLLARVSYHLGNRHVALQIGAEWVRYQHDHVLDDMVRGLGVEVSVEQAAFEPETGAYSGHAGSAAHSHHHD